VRIEIRKAQFLNKGAELMLRSIIAKLRERLPEATLVMAPPTGYDSYFQRSTLGLYQKLWLQRYRIQWGYFGCLIPKKIRKMYGMVLDSEIDVVLDASGFSYSDQWGTGSSLEVSKSLRKWKKQGTKVIFMPQAFGPFFHPKIKKAFKEVIQQADLIYAREGVSYKHLIELAGNHENIRVSPDFTNLIKGELPGHFDSRANRFCLIPNYRMIDKTVKRNSKIYIPFLITCAKYLYEKDVKPFILINEGDKDLWLSKQVVKGLGRDINIIQERNALHIKGIIGASEGVISSRFHGLVSALSQGIPAIATGWSHKYEMLFQDYGFPEGMLAVDATTEEIHRKIDMLISVSRNQHIKSSILNSSLKQKQATIKMWEEVFAMIIR
jgi:polysaccharide pyruvyl transferase WcaK-like protein